MKTPRTLRSRHRAQRGAVLLFAMIALVVLLIGTVALMRSMNTSLFTAGNFGFKRDLTNQGERAIATVLDLVQTGALGSEVARESSATARNYSASILPTNGDGIPLALLSDAAFAAVGVAGNDISPADMGVTVRYVVDRLCVAAGPASPNSCSVTSPPPQGGSNDTKDDDDLPVQFVYRVSIRVDGPRRTQSFFQSTFTI
jgi:type IV pilus assembly protein PilX